MLESSSASYFNNSELITSPPKVLIFKRNTSFSKVITLPFTWVSVAMTVLLPVEEAGTSEVDVTVCSVATGFGV